MINVQDAREEFFELLSPEVDIEVLWSGPMGVGEGPNWNPREGYLVFTDLPGDVIRAWRPSDEVSELVRPTNMANGLTYDAELRLLICEHNTSRVVRREADGSVTVIASHYEGKELNSPNDVVVDRSGRIYFTDPDYGRQASPWGIERPLELGFCGVFGVEHDGANLVPVATDFVAANGLCFSPTEEVLYVNDTSAMHIRRFRRAPGGAFTGGEVFFEFEGSGLLQDGVPDGMKCDIHGNVYCTGPGGLWVIDSAGRLLGKVRTPYRAVNFNWGPPNWSTLYIGCEGAICRLPTRVQGNLLPYMTAA